MNCMMEVDTEINDLNKTTNMEVDEVPNQVEEAAITPDIESNIEIKEEPEDRDDIMELDVSKESKDGNESDAQRENEESEVRNEPESHLKETESEVSSKKEENVLTEVKNEPVEPEEDLQTEVEKELLKTNDSTESGIGKQLEERDENREVRKDLEQPNENIESEVGKELEHQDKTKESEIEQELEQQNDSMESEAEKELEQQAEDKESEVGKEQTQQAVNKESEAEKELEQQDGNKESEKELEQQDKNRKSKAKTEQEEQHEIMEVEAGQESEELHKNSMHEATGQSVDQDENMELEVRKEPEKQDENIKSQVEKESEDQDKSKQLEVKNEPKDETKNEQPEINDIVNDTKKDEDFLESSECTDPDLKDIMRLSAGVSTKEDDDEENIYLTAEEVKEYLLKKIGEYMNSSVNPLYALRAKAKELEEKGRSQVEEYCKLYKGLQLLQRKHENFLRNVDILPKITMCHANVSADLPMEAVPNPEALIKKDLNIKDLSITKVDLPTSKPVPIQPKPTPPPVSKTSNIECIDLTDENDLPTNTAKNTSYSSTIMAKHPAPLPPRPFAVNAKRVPPKPRLIISSEDRGIVLQWDMPPNPKHNPIFDPIATFEIFGYQEQRNSAINTSLWKKIGSVKSMSLPMACTLTQFVDKNKYHFSIRAVDINGLCGYHSDPISIVYKQKVPK